MITLTRDEEICVGDRKTSCRRKKEIKVIQKNILLTILTNNRITNDSLDGSVNFRLITQFVIIDIRGWIFIAVGNLLSLYCKFICHSNYK